MHVTRADRADEFLAVYLAQGEGREDRAGTCASAYCQIPRLDRGMRRVGREMMRMAEQCLDLINADSVLLAFGDISFIPIEPGNCRPVH